MQTVLHFYPVTSHHANRRSGTTGADCGPAGFCRYGFGRVGTAACRRRSWAATALENFATGLDLAELERLLAGEKQAQIAALERFATASDLKTLRELAEEQRTEFDAIDFLRLSNDEEFHSNFLAWLLGPNNNHGVGDYFLKKFLCRVGLSSESIESVDWTPAESQREWRNVADGQPGSFGHPHSERINRIPLRH